MRLLCTGAPAVLAVAIESAVFASTVVSGLTFSVSGMAIGPYAVGTGMLGSGYGGSATVQSITPRPFAESIKGMSEFGLSGLIATRAGTLGFTAMRAGGLGGQPGFDGEIRVLAYRGDNAASLSDFGASALVTLGTFSTAGLAAGSRLSFDVTDAVNDALAAGWVSFGVRLERVGAPGDNRAWMFDGFTLTSDAVAAPLPRAAAIGVCAMAAMPLTRRRARTGAGLSR